MLVSAWHDRFFPTHDLYFSERLPYVFVKEVATRQGILVSLSQIVIHVLPHIF